MTEPTVDSELDRLIQVTPEMVMAGLEAINPRLIERDPERAVTEIYRAMEKAK